MPDVLGPADAGAVNTLTTTTDVTNPAAGDTWFQDCVANNPATGTNLPSRYMNRVLQQLRRVIRQTGIVDTSNADDDMLGRAIQSGAMNWAGTFGGTANALTATLTPVAGLLVPGLEVNGIVAATNTGAATLNGIAITLADANTLKGGEMVAGGGARLLYTGSVFLLLTPAPTVFAGRLLGVQTFTSTGTYTPTPGMTYGIAEGCGGGGGASGGINPTAGNLSLGAPGGGATSGKAFFTAAQIGSSKAVTIGAGGAGGSAASGSAGGTTSLGSLLSLPGGTSGSIFNTTGFPAFNGNGSTSAAATGANISSKRGATPGYATAVSAAVAGVFCGPGGDTPYGTSVGNAANTNGPAGSGNGSGGAGVALTNGGGPANGGAGAGGVLIITEYGV